ncbi:MAG TPA: GNAT family N-acetyltransferase, partial [Rhodanobacteraceae bacterium]|nr:GNAT family N-acetyltransferase [Rhodanobacteraceae bacterium]
IALREDADHASPNFRWFRERYPAFVYIDRIVVANAYRRHGLGRVFYCDVHSYAELRTPLLTCEVFLEPRDDVAVLFHGTYGFHEVGQQVMAGTGRHVSLLAKELCSYAFVHDQYLAKDGLPTLPWLAERERPASGDRQRLAGSRYA